MHRAPVGHAGKACTNFHALHGIQAHHRVGNVGIELVIQRLAQAHRHARGLHPDTRAARVPGLAQGVHVILILLHVGHGGEEGVAAHMVPALERDGQLAQLRHAGAEFGAVLLRQPLLGHGACRHRGRRQAGGRPAAAARVADAVLVPVGVVSMAGAEALGDVAVVLAALVGVADQQGNGGAGGLALVHAREDFHRIGLVALRDVAAGARAAPVQVGLDVSLGEGHAGRAAVNHAANGRAVGFTKVGDCE